MQAEKLYELYGYMAKMKVSCVQTNSSDSVEQNIKQIIPLIKEAAAQGSNLIALPENAFLMAVGEAFHTQVYAENEHPALQASLTCAVETKSWLLIGSMAVKNDLNEGNGSAKYLNRSYLIAPDGRIAARYDKIHLFDVSVPGGESHQESARFKYGTEAIVAHTEFGPIGLSICYDVRFPHLYRTLAQRGANILAVPAAFTKFTGEKGGWHVLNRARAMETGCFVIAPAQCGEHAGGRKTYGHSLLIGPWGDVLAEGQDDVGIISAEIDLEDVCQTRQIMPSLSHDRKFKLKELHYAMD